VGHDTGSVIADDAARPPFQLLERLFLAAAAFLGAGLPSALAALPPAMRREKMSQFICGI
jgi:hypothetical protein